MDNFEHEYRLREAVWKRLEEEAKFILSASLLKATIKTHSLISRIKSLESVREKAARKSTDNPLTELEDLVGIRVVCLLRSDIEKIGQLVRQHFDVITEDNKLDGVDVAAFGYQSVHFIVQLSKECTGPRYEGLHKVGFEIQLRTLAMDAWAALSHYLDYKNEIDVPKNLRKDFFALSGLFYVADTHFELFYAERQKSRISASQAALEGPDIKQELNLDTLSAFLRKRYPNRGATSPNGVSELMGELVGAGYTTVDALSEVLDKSSDAFERYEAVHPPLIRANKKFGRYADVGVVRLSLAIANDKFAREKYSHTDAILEFRKFLKN